MTRQMTLELEFIRAAIAVRGGNPGPSIDPAKITPEIEAALRMEAARCGAR